MPSPAPERTETERHAEVDRIVDAFTEAVKAPIPPKPARRWAWPVTLAVAVVAGALLATSQLKPQIASLTRSLDYVQTNNYHLGQDIVKALHLRDTARAENAKLQQQNDALALQSEANVERWSDDEATMHAASHDVERAEDAVQTWLNMDQLDNRDQAIKVRRALERAERRLK
jgi:hypothetical protein